VSSFIRTINLLKKIKNTKLKALLISKILMAGMKDIEIVRILKKPKTKDS
jgi:hypothetical protein